ncbi:ferredoxin reductase [Mycolicibacterium madagascariense]|uniref:Ferredoxin reductase n=1 Tax=Mycolicibacterium madagascariense TaxID=212765 RepID=A0A7I7XDE9_9MYCO|nr:FAD/NAD(P)-binding oxidoreductase [Mycolicibacterium madagascariense]MCV7013642.1 NAD(P)/FAD-dependent oxidoreductase [Mycolicibacterium madagascariense]BBZ27405.1 ferredoxin reductase [Mycolicibacterium madagascariense]
MSGSGLLIVGSGPGGVSAAEAFREHDRDSPVRILTADPEPPYARPPLSKDYLRGETDDVWLHPADWYAERGIDLSSGVEVSAIDPGAHTVTVGAEVLSYDALVLACGAAPMPLPVPGGHFALSLRSLADAARLRRRADDATSAVVVGAGFIGCEVAASLAMHGVAVTLVAPQDFPQEKRLGRAAGERLLGLVTDAGVRYAGGVSVRALDEGVVHVGDGVDVHADLVVAATGVRPRITLAEAAGLQVRDGRVVVGSDMRTSAADVYAVGDVALAFNGVAGRHVAVEHWQDADDHGAVAGANAAGADSTWDDVPGFWSTIGESTIKHHAWGDGYDRDYLVTHDDGFTVWYEADGATVGVLTCNADDDYDAGERLIAEGRPSPRGATPRPGHRP